MNVLEPIKIDNERFFETITEAKKIFSEDNSSHINTLIDMLNDCVLHDDYNSVYTILTVLRERLKPEFLHDLGAFFEKIEVKEK